MKNQIVFAVFALCAQTAFASGFEKSIMWGGETSGLAGIATPQISGSSAIYFNPAGLTGDTGGANDIGLNLSPGTSQFKAPINDPNTQESSVGHTAISGGFTYSHNFGPWALGVGYYASGGSYADFKDQTVKSTTSGLAMAGTYDVKTDLAITEFAVGGGYKVMDNLSLGLAYRIVMVKANLAKVQATANPNAYAQVNFDDLKDTNYTGFKLGAQYKLSDKTSFGFAYRSEVNFKAKGTQTVVVHSPTNAALQTTSTDVTAGTALPASWTLGLRHACTDTLNVFAEYNYTEYGKIDNISTQTSSGGGTPILLKLKDQHLIKLAGEYTGFMMPIRAGVIFGTRVTNADYALATGTPPGPAWVATLGTGYGMKTWRVDGGLEYNTAQGTANSNTVHPTLANAAANEASAITLHLGGSLSF